MRTLWERYGTLWDVMGTLWFVMVVTRTLWERYGFYFCAKLESLILRCLEGLAQIKKIRYQV